MLGFKLWRRAALPALAALLALGGLSASAVPALAQPQTATPNDPAYLGFFPTPQPKGEISLEIRADARATGKVVVVAAGVPFPPGFVSDTNQIWLKDNLGQEMPIFVKTLATWRQPVPQAGSLRVVLVQFQDLISSTAPRRYTLGWGSPRKESEPMGWPSRDSWLPSEPGNYPVQNASTPPVLVSLPASWLGQSLLKGRILPAGKSQALDFYDAALERALATATNNLDPQVETKYRTELAKDAEPWLYDRAGTLFVAYLRRGGADTLSAAHQAAQFYASQVQPDGKLALLGSKSGPDLKYGYQECLALDYWLTGDERMLETSQRVYKLLDTWDPHYSAGKSFWTERHLGFALLNATVSYELTGEPVQLERAKMIFDAAYQMQFDTHGGSPPDGCFVHTGRQHGEKAEGWLCSVWMSALVVDAMLRYYLVSADPRVPRSLEALADFVVRHGSYRDQPHPSIPKPLTFPHYLIGSRPVANLEVDPWTDRQHAIDTSLIIAAADYFARKSGRNKPEYKRMLGELEETARWNFEKHYYSDAPMRNKSPNFPILPPRKFSWWFRTTACLDWFLTQP